MSDTDTLEWKLSQLRQMYNRRCAEIAELQTKLDKANAHHRMTYYIDNKPETMSEPVYWHIRKLEDERRTALDGNDKLEASLNQAIKDLNQSRAELAEANAPRHIDTIGRAANDALRHGLHEVANKLHELAHSIGVNPPAYRPIQHEFRPSDVSGFICAKCGQGRAQHK